MSTEYPILILRSCFHVGALNSRALELLHINRDTVGHYGAFAEVDETGAPNGVVKENVLDDIKAAIPSVGLSPLLEQVVQSQHDLLAEGLTSIQSDDFKYAPDEEPYALMDGLRELAERGALKLRFAEQALLTEPETLEEFFTRGGACFGRRRPLPHLHGEAPGRRLPGGADGLPAGALFRRPGHLRPAHLPGAGTVGPAGGHRPPAQYGRCHPRHRRRSG